MVAADASMWSVRPAPARTLPQRPARSKCFGFICTPPGRRAAMIDDAVKAFAQLFAAPLRAVLWKSIGLALALIVVAGIALERLIVHLVNIGGASAEATFGMHWPVTAAAWLLSIAAGVGIVVGSVMLMPAVTAMVGSFFADQIADEVEREHYPGDRPGKALPLWLALWEGLKAALFALIVYLCAAPLLLFAGFGVVVFFLATAYVLGRVYFELAAMRLRSPAEAKALRRRYAPTVYVGGLFIAAFVSIPLLNLATPIFAMALMVHLHKRVSRKL
jgi:uncharacterized protein involved in cysteine biosynthesis